MNQPKFYVEAFYAYYPAGGTNDFSQPYDSLEEAKKAADLNNDWVSIIKIENNVLEHIAWYSGSAWTYLDDPV